MSYRDIEVERLRAENARLRAALDTLRAAIVEECGDPDDADDEDSPLLEAVREADEALAGTGDD